MISDRSVELAAVYEHGSAAEINLDTPEEL